MSEDLEQERLGALYVAAMRQRFKDEINRLTSSAMRRMLDGVAQADDWAFLLSYLFAYHWLRQNLSEGWRVQVLAGFKGGQRAFLMDLLERSSTTREFVRAYIKMLPLRAGQLAQSGELERLLAHHQQDAEALTDRALAIWQNLGLFKETPKEAYARLAREERNRYGELLGEADQQRLALVDQLPGKPTRRFEKLALIPHMGCPQTCRHCMFIFRPLLKDYPDPAQLMNELDGLSSNLLFTGGDLSKHLAHFYRAIGTMRSITQFAILLNGEFARDEQTTRQVLDAMSAALQSRPPGWPQAGVLLQISFDEFHQEILPDKNGGLHERIPVANIANLVEAVVHHPGIQLALLHKQTRLNFSLDVLHKGVFARLTQELGRRGQQVQVLSARPSNSPKQDPVTSGLPQPVLRDATFILSSHPERPILLSSSTIDAYGRAELLDESETLKDRASLQALLSGKPAGEGLDTDLMFWFDGRVTLFSATHISLGNVYVDGLERIRSRHASDPLLKALASLDARLLDWYAEMRDDLEQIKQRATSAHQLFHSLTESAEVRLYLTKRLLGEMAAVDDAAK